MGGEARKGRFAGPELYLSLPEPVVSLEQCEQLVAELQGSVRQAVRLYHLVRVGHPPTSAVPAQYPESDAKALPLVGVEQSRTSWAEEASGLEARSGHLNKHLLVTSD